MSLDTENFVGLCLNGDVLADEIDDFVDRWHEGDSEKSLAEFLGLSAEEYALWFEKPESIKLILKARKLGRPLDSLPSASDAQTLLDDEPPF